MSKKKKNQLLLQPTNEFHQWLSELTESDSSLSFNLPQGYTKQTTILYTLPPFNTETEFKDWLNLNFKIILKNELIAWNIPENHWPDLPSLDTFNSLFTFTYIPKSEV